MTIICTDGKTIAADGRIIAGHSEINQDSFPKIRIDAAKRRIYAIAGIVAVFDAAVAWHAAGAKPADAPKIAKDYWQLLVIDKQGPAVFTNEIPYPDRWSYPFALGTGQDFAIGVLLAGLSPRRAVELVCTRDAHCGGTILEIDIAEVLAPRKRKDRPRVNGDGRHILPVKSRSEIRHPLTGTWTKRADKAGKFMDVKAHAKPFRGVRSEKAEATE